MEIVVWLRVYSLDRSSDLLDKVLGILVGSSYAVLSAAVVVGINLWANNLGRIEFG